MPPNWQNRTMWTGDNLDIMRGMNSESVDVKPPRRQDPAVPQTSLSIGAPTKLPHSVHEPS